MEVHALHLKDFRNYSDETVEFLPGLNVIVGNNGHGKTNLLEAVHFLSAQGSHRTSTNGALVRHGAESSVIRSRCGARSRDVSIDCEIKSTGGSRMLVNKVPLDRVPGRDPMFSCVIFSPEDLAMVKAGPEERRRFIDQLASKRKPLAAADRQEFERVLRQRNGVLKAAHSNPRALKQLDVWTEQFVKAASAVIGHRAEALSEARPHIDQMYRTIADADQGPSVNYEASWSPAPTGNEAEVTAALTRALEEVAAREIERGVTLVGPQRDDIALGLADVDARVFASQGEQRSIALALRLAERAVVAEERGEQPVLLLDDVFSELDDDRRGRLAELVADAGQTIATATTADGLPLKGGKTMRIESGAVVQDA